MRTKKLAELELNFTRLVSHELKTPIATIRSLSENLTAGIGTDANRAREYGTVIGEESLRLSRMVQNILFLMTLKNPDSKRIKESLDLGAIARELVDAMEKNLRGKAVSLKVMIAEDIPRVQGRQIAISAAIDNLLNNAITHGVSESGVAEVVVGVCRRRRGCRDGAELTVSDRGAGIPALERGKIFQAFYRGEEADRRQLSGSGIGLNLTKLAVHSFGGKLIVTSRLGQGTTIGFWLKADKP